MKRILSVLMVALVWMALAIPASAVENEFGGYWRTRVIGMQDFNGTDIGTTSYVDTRTRLYYTAKFSDKFKFVNKFEIDTYWGDTDGGDIGADGRGISTANSHSHTATLDDDGNPVINKSDVSINNVGSGLEIKNSYIDFSVADSNFKVGIQPGKIARGFIFDDDFSGLTATFKVGSVILPFMWMKVEEDDITNAAAKSERDYFAFSPVFNLNETLSLNPYVFFDKQQSTDTQIFYVGADINAKMNNVTAWGTAILEAGDRADHDCSAYLVAAGADAGLVHGQFFYASGNDADYAANDKGDDWNEFGVDFSAGKGETYYWSEIMGEGIFDGTRSNNAPGTGVTNIMAANVGVTVKAMDKLTLTGDLWYAQLAEERMVNGSMEDVLGFEIDLKATYMVLDNLKLDVVAAYLIAGDATGEEDPIEIGTQLSFSF